MQMFLFEVTLWYVLPQPPLTDSLPYDIKIKWGDFLIDSCYMPEVALINNQAVIIFFNAKSIFIRLHS